VELDVVRRSIDALSAVYPDIAEELRVLRANTLEEADAAGLDQKALEQAALIIGRALGLAFAHKGSVAQALTRHPQDQNGIALRRVIAWALAIDPDEKP